MRAARDALHPRHRDPWTARDDLRLVEASAERRGTPDWIAISRRLGRSMLAVQGRVVLLRSARRIAAALDGGGGGGSRGRPRGR